MRADAFDLRVTYIVEFFSGLMYSLAVDTKGMTLLYLCRREVNKFLNKKQKQKILLPINIQER